MDGSERTAGSHLPPPSASPRLGHFLKECCMFEVTEAIMAADLATPQFLVSSK